MRLAAEHALLLMYRGSHKILLLFHRLLCREATGINERLDTIWMRWMLQMVVEKMLREEGKSRLEMGRQAFEERVWQWKGEYGGFITQQMRRMGASCDWSRERFTLDSQLSGAAT